MEIHIKGEDFGHKPKREKPKPKQPWFCDCGFRVNHVGKWQPPYLVNCPDCGARRPY